MGDMKQLTRPANKGDTVEVLRAIGKDYESDPEHALLLKCAYLSVVALSNAEGVAYIGNDIGPRLAFVFSCMYDRDGFSDVQMARYALRMRNALVMAGIVPKDMKPDDMQAVFRIIERMALTAEEKT